MLSNHYLNLNKEVLFSHTIISFIIDEDFWSYLSFSFIYDLVEMLSIIEVNYLNFFNNINIYKNIMNVNKIASIFSFINVMEDYSYEYIYIIIKGFLLSYLSFSYHKFYYTNASNYFLNENINFFSNNINFFSKKKINVSFIMKKNNYFFSNSSFFFLNNNITMNYLILNKYIKLFSFSIKNIFLINKPFFFYIKNYFYNSNFLLLHLINFMSSSRFYNILDSHIIKLFSPVLVHNTRFLFHATRYNSYNIINSFYYSQLIKTKYLYYYNNIFINDKVFKPSFIKKYNNLYYTTRFYRFFRFFSTDHFINI